MATQIKQPSKELYNELTDKLLQKAGMKKETIYRTALKRWVNSNLDLLTPVELKRYNSIIL
ncbi:MAG: hypothetical protein LBB53_06185 [Prevotellaceae bacterium]|nr:hypothetical protein [Prevotellaceae bacterium]